MLQHPHLYLMKLVMFKGLSNVILHFTLFKDDRQYDSQYETHAIACLHGTETVLYPHYSPTETSQALLWVEIK